MIKLSHAALIAISGCLWLAIGVFLFQLGVKLLVSSSEAIGGAHPLIYMLSPRTGGPHQAAMLLVALAMFLGYWKGKFVLAKTVRRNVTRIKTLPNPSSITKLFTPAYVILIAVMMGLGLGIRFFGLADDIRGLIDLAVGAALLNGAITYFRHAFELRKATA